MKWNKILIDEEDIIKVTPKHVLIQLKKIKGYEHYIVCHVRKLFHQKEVNQYMMLFTDQFKFCLKQYKDDDVNKEIIYEKICTGKKFQELWKKKGNPQMR